VPIVWTFGYTAKRAILEAPLNQASQSHCRCSRKGYRTLPVNCEERARQYVIRLEGEIDVACSTDLKRGFIDTIASEKETVLDVKAATDFDVTALQLIWAAMVAAENVKKVVTIEGEIPEEIVNAVRDAGFEPLLAPLISQAERDGEAASEASDD
jgi:anti-anti-sigma regulatory factor